MKDKRIIILDETDANQSTFIGFVDSIMPDLYEEEENELIVNTMQKIYEKEIVKPVEIAAPVKSIEVLEEPKKIEDDNLPF